MLKQEIIIRVLEDGKIEFETEGFVGDECVKNEDVQFIKSQLGRGLGPDFKPIYYAKNQTKTVFKNLCG
jgi:hypothetical protein